MGVVLGISEASKLIGVHPEVMRDWVKQGLVTGKRIGKCYYINRDHFNELYSQLKNVKRNETLLTLKTQEQEQLLSEYDDKIKKLREDLTLVSKMGHVLSTKKLFSAIIQAEKIPTREAEVLLLVIEGYSFSEIAKRLHISNQLARQRYCRTLENIPSFAKIGDLLSENARLKKELATNNALIERLYKENDHYRKGNINSNASADYIFSTYHFLKRRLRYIDFSARTYNALGRANIHTIGELIRLSLKDILQIRGIRKKCSDEIIAYTENLGMCLGFNVDAINESYKRLYGENS